MNPLLNATNSSGMGKMQQIAGLVRILKSGNSEQIAQQMLQNNPNFAAFMRRNQGKTPQQVAKENGIDLNSLMNQFR